MSKLPLKNIKGDHVGDVEIPDDLLVFDKGGQSVHDVVSAYNASQRAGSASTLTKAEVRATGSKPWRQKGTGRARAGYRSSPIWRGGGVAFGPKPRSYSKKVPKKVARLAFRRAFSDKVAAGEVTVVEGFELEAPKTKMMASMLKSLEASSNTLVVLDQFNEALALAARNIPKVELTTTREMNTYQVLRYRNIIVTKPAADQLQDRLMPAARKKGDA